MLSQVKFIMVGGPSGVGKTAVIGHLLASSSTLYRPLTYTTRPKRTSDQPDQFRYLSQEEFEQLSLSGAFVRADEVLGAYYAMAAKDLLINPSFTPIKEIHTKDHLAFKRQLPSSISVLILPENWENYRTEVSRMCGNDPSRTARLDAEVTYYSTVSPESTGADIVLVNDWRRSTISLARELECELQRLFQVQRPNLEMS